MKPANAWSPALRVWERLVAPHPSISSPEDLHGARLFANLMLIHLAATAVLILTLNEIALAGTGRTVWRDMDTWTAIVGAVLIAAAYGILRSGRYRIGAGLYIAAATAIPLTGPFMPDPHAEIGVLATAIIPVLAASYIWSSAQVSALMGGITVFGVVLIAISGLTTTCKGTGVMILISVLVAGTLVMVAKHRFGVLDRARTTRLRESETALEESTERLRMLLSNSLDVLVGTDRHGFVTFIGGSFEEATGYTIEERLGRSIFDNILPDDVGRVRGEFDNLLVERPRMLRTEWRQSHRDGRTIWIEALVANRLGHPGLDNVVLSLRDVTGRREAEEGLRQSEAKYRSLFQAVSDGLFIADAKGTVLEVNDAACRQLGYAREELVGRPLTLFAPHMNESPMTRASRAIRDEGGSFLTSHRRKDGRDIPVDLSVTEIVFQGSRAFLGVARDMTARKTARQDPDS